MKSKSIVAGAVLTGVLLAAGAAEARVDVFVHGRNSGTPNTTDYWHVGYGSGNDGVLGMTGNNTEGNYVYAYDATVSWSVLSSSTAPVCALTSALNAAPGTDFAVLTHSAGGLVAAYMLSVAQNGWATSCGTSPATAASWVTYLVTTAAPWRGSELANAVYGNTGGNFLQQACGTVAGSLSNLIFNQASNMTWALQTSTVQNNYGALVGYSSTRKVYTNWGTGNGGDDSTSMGWASWCAGMPTPNDGVVAAYSSSYAIPGQTTGWSDSVGHSSNRRDDYQSFATHVWTHNPY